MADPSLLGHLVETWGKSFDTAHLRCLLYSILLPPGTTLSQSNDESFEFRATPSFLGHLVETSGKRFDMDVWFALFDQILFPPGTTLSQFNDESFVSSWFHRMRSTSYRSSTTLAYGTISIRNDVKLRCGLPLAKDNWTKTRARTRAQIKALENMEQVESENQQQQEARQHESNKQTVKTKNALDNVDATASTLQHRQTGTNKKKALDNVEPTAPIAVGKAKGKSKAKAKSKSKKKKAPSSRAPPEDRVASRPSIFPNNATSDIASKIPPPMKKASTDLNKNKLSEGVNLLRTFLTTTMTLPEAEQALDSLFGRKVSSEHPWCNMLARITGVEDDEGVSAVLHLLDTMLEDPTTNQGTSPKSPSDSAVTAPSPLPKGLRQPAQPSSICHRNLERDPPSPLKEPSHQFTPHRPSSVHRSSQPAASGSSSAVKKKSHPLSPRKGMSSRPSDPDPLRPVRHNKVSEIEPSNELADLTFDPESHLFDFEVEEFAEDDREILELVNTDIYMDLDRYYMAAACNQVQANIIWHQLNDALFDLVVASTGGDITRSTPAAEIRALARIDNIDEYNSLRDDARIEWRDVCGVEEEVKRLTASPRSLFSGSDESPRSLFGGSDEEELEPSQHVQPLVDYASSSYDPHDFLQNGRGDNNEDDDGDDNGAYIEGAHSGEESEGSEEGEGSDGGDKDEGSEVDDTDVDDGEGSEKKQPGQLPKAIKEELRQLQEEYEEKVAAVAAKAKKNVHACWRFLNEKTSLPREVSPFNAFQAWYRKKGDEKRPENMSPQKRNVQVAKKYHAIIAEKLEQEDPEDPETLREMFAEQIEWFESEHEAYMAKKKGEGKFRGTVKSMLKPLYTIGKELYRNTGGHLLGHFIITDHEADGKSRSVIQEHSVNLRTQLTDIETMIKMKEMKQRGVDAKLAELAVKCTKAPTQSGRDRNRKAISAIFTYDAERLVDDDPKLLAPGKFAENAYRYHVRIVNWPVDLPFFTAGIDSVHSMRCKDLSKVALPRIAQIMQDADWVVPKSDRTQLEEAASEKCFEMVSWDEDEIEMPLEDQATLPIVQDTNGNAVLTVSYSENYQKDIGIDVYQRSGSVADEPTNDTMDNRQGRESYAPLFREDTPPAPTFSKSRRSKEFTVPTRWYQGPRSATREPLVPQRAGGVSSIRQRAGGEAERSIPRPVAGTSRVQRMQSTSAVPAQRRMPVGTTKAQDRSTLHARGYTETTDHARTNEALHGRRQQPDSGPVHERMERRAVGASRMAFRGGEGNKRKMSPDTATPPAKRLKLDTVTSKLAGHKRRRGGFS
ncbi:hypothetical protein EV360DRAFT_73043 [Lentinula raphanica]|nr:hypothetical protein EV360DRAFT_73043 [Lentinula raphanica]